MPLVGSPMELIIPPSTSATRGGGLPARNSRETVFATSAPRRLRSITCARSVEKAPDAGMIGFFERHAPDLHTHVYHPTASCRSNTGPFDANAAQLLLAVDLEGAHADVAGPEPASHDLLHGDLAGNAVRLAEAFHQLKEPVGAAGEEGIGFALRDQRLQDAFHVLDCARAVAVEHADDVADFREQVVGHHEFGAARAQNRGDANAGFARELRDRRHGGKPHAAAEHDDVLPGRIDGEAHAERPHHVERVAAIERRQPVRAAADAFVEKLDAAVLAVDAVDALRPAQPQLAFVGRRAEQIEELAGLDFERLGRGFDDEMLVFGVDPVVGDDRAQRFFGRDMIQACEPAL